MYIIFLMIAISVTVAAAFLGAFLWAVRSGQYDDDYTPSVRMLFDNEVAPTGKGKDANKPQGA
ncbi:cbb3-type cytochrome oxidase maturation protein [Pontibacter aydingkolensis]|uniref:Cbb3-type cytochrome oxidase assembly protein CcoS n=1 Tax=Pontibacter aydingkolensis TaxID=1911536 RepID=A0ABS7CX81_9BACT|nr:cbb3-type cytochrome oxidase assembly protein CcoS [Pontibacter aydingkolensis]MBW7468440.1 cbb3-type cytochrome oxidase assembly protein CcoS [Pontibacter aydingkolensis]